VSGKFHVPTALLPGKDTGTYWMESWVDPRVGLDTVVVGGTFPDLVGNRTCVKRKKKLFFGISLQS